jgi:hypothetical protein
MSFPGTYNINYYYGDTLEFNVYPKNSSGDVFDNLGSFQTARFTIAPTRGADVESQVFAYAQVSSDNTYIACAIRPEDAARLSPSTSYVYDIEIAKTSDQSLTPYDIVYTLLTGTISITQDVTKPESNPLPEIPLGATGLTLESSTPSTLEVSWTAPTSGGTPTAYRVAIIPFTTDQSNLENAINASLVTTNQTSYIFFGLAENTDYSVVILPTNSAGDALDENLLTNASAFTTTDNPLTIEPDFVITNEGSGAYLIDGISNDTITLVRGETYLFEIDASGHPFWIQTTPAPYNSGNVYNSGITNNGTDEGVLIWAVAQNAPSTLFYACQFHPSMSGTIVIVDGES